MTAILGISAFYHDSAAALVVDGEIVAAAQEERFTRKKHDPEFPAQAIACCLEEAGLDATGLDYVAFYDKPFAKFDRLLETYLAYAPAGLRSFSLAMPLWLRQKLHLRRIIRAHLEGCRAPLLFMDHHESHAASAFFPSPFDEAAILTLDGVGEWSTTTYGTGTGNRLELTHHVSFPHSLGLLYSAFTYYCGFRVNSGEYKLMGLAPYGRPTYADEIREHLIDVKPDGSFWLNMDYFNYCQGLTMTGPRFHALLGGLPRAPESPIEPRHMDLAASIQAVTEEVILRMARHLHEQTRMKHLVLAGGVALNCVANGHVLREGPFDELWIQPRGRRRRGRASAPRSSCGINYWRSRASWVHPITSRAACLAPGSPPTGSRRSWPGSDTTRIIGRMNRTCSITSSTSWREDGSSDGFKGGWSLVPARSEPEAFWATRGLRKPRRR